MLLWLDLETTGLDPREDHILEIAWTLTYSDLTSMTPYGILSTAVKTDIALFDARANDYVREMHTKTGLIERIQGEDAITRSMAERDLIGVLEKALAVVDEPIYLAGASVHFDLAFLKFWMPALAKMLSHRVYDTSTLKAFFGDFVAIPTELANPNQHSAASDVEEVLAVARHYRQQMQIAQDIVIEYTLAGNAVGAPEAGWPDDEPTARELYNGTGN